MAPVTEGHNASIVEFVPELDRLAADVMADWKVPGAAVTVVGSGMNRRSVLKSAAVALLPGLAPRAFAAATVGGAASKPRSSRVRPGDPAWPAATDWERLRQQVGGRLIAVQSPLRRCRDDPVGLACDDVFAGLRNPYYVADEVGLTQTAGWLNAWTSQPSVYAVAAKTTGDVVHIEGQAPHRGRGVNCWVTETKDAPLVSRISTILAKSASERVSRSTL